MKPPRKYSERGKRPDRLGIINDALGKFPHVSTNEVARTLFTNHPEHFVTLNAARNAVKLRRGANGAADRKYKSHPVSQYDTTGYPPIPESLEEPWVPFAVEGEQRVGVLADIHLPYHDKLALESSVDHLDTFNPTLILLNGDTADFYGISRFDRDPRRKKLRDEVDIVRQFLAHLRGRFPDTRIIYKLGNHDERWYSYLYQKAPELAGIDVLDFAKVIHADKYGIETVGDQRIIMLGKLPVLHGHELPKGMTNPVNPARGAFLRALETVMVSHSHRTSEHPEAALLGGLITCWSTGCLCGLHPEYARVNRWNHGAATVEVDSDGQFNVRNFKIKHGAVYSG